MAAAEAGEAGSSEQPKVEVSRIAVSPNQCEIHRELSLEIDFTVDRPIANPVWVIKYIVDYTNKRKEIGRPPGCPA